MPRTLPWLPEKAAQRGTTRVAAKPKAKHRSSSPGDLVGSDLEDLEDELTRPGRAEQHKAAYREPSSSPPPVVKPPPPKELMIPGYAADDAWMMVEDEFCSTAQLYTQHLHQAEYARLKRLHKSRGQATLAALARGTDGRTEQSKQLQLKLQAQENVKKRKQFLALESDSEEEDEYMLDPQLAGLMTGSQRGGGQDLTKFANARSRRTVAEDGDESSDPLPEPDLSPVAEEDEETDSDDLDAPPRKLLAKGKAPVRRPIASSSGASSSTPRAPQPADRVFKQLARKKTEERRSTNEEPLLPLLPSLPSSPPPIPPALTEEKPKSTEPWGDRVHSPIRHDTSTVRRPLLSKQEDSSSQVDECSRSPLQIKEVGDIMEEKSHHASAFLAKRRAQKEKDQAEAKRREIEDSIPTFLY